MRTINNELVLRRGDVYMADLPTKEGSHKQTGTRPIVIFSNDKNNTFCAFVHYVPISSELKRLYLPVHIQITSEFMLKPSIALCEQAEREDKIDLINYIDKKKGRIGKLSDYDMEQIGYGVAVQFGLYA